MILSYYSIIIQVIYESSYLEINFILSHLLKFNDAYYNILLFIILLTIRFFIIKINYNYNYILSIIIVSTTIVFIINTTIYNIEINSWHSNSLISTLTNGLLVVHPLCLYLYYSLFLLSLLLLSHFFYKNKKVIIFNSYPSNKQYCYNIGLLALLLGSWWSHQELNWGGLWSWDLVEIFLVIIIIYSLHIVHIDYTRSSIIKIILLLINFSIYIVSIRYNLINSIHNFFIEDSSLYQINYITIIFILIFSLIYLVIYYLDTSYKIIHISINNLLELIYIVLVIYVYITYIYFYSIGTLSDSLIIILPIILTILSMAIFTLQNMTAVSSILPLVEVLLITTIYNLIQTKNKVRNYHILILLAVLHCIIYFNIVILLSSKQPVIVTTSIAFNNCSNIFLSNYIICYNIIISKLAVLYYSLFIIDSMDTMTPIASLEHIPHNAVLVSNNYGFIFYPSNFFFKLNFIEGILAYSIIFISISSYYKYIYSKYTY